MPVRRPEEFRSGDRLSASRLNGPIRAIYDIVGAVAPPRDSSGSPVNYPQLQQFELRSVQKDYLICRAVVLDATSTEIIGTQDVTIAKPYLLRGSISTRGGINYVYNLAVPGFVERTGTRISDSATETQVVVPSYIQGDRIFAWNRVIGGTGVKDLNNNPVQYLEQEGARAWAKK